MLVSIAALRLGVVMKPLMHYISPCPGILSYTSIESGSTRSLAMP